MKRNTKIALILAAALGAGTAGVAVAHGGGGSGGWGGGGYGPMMGGGMMGYGAGGPGYGGRMMGPGMMGPGMMGPGMMGPGYGGPGMMGYGHGAPGRMGNAMMGPAHGGWGRHHGPGAAARFEQLADRLQLTEAQKPLWNDFRDTIQKQAAARRDASQAKGAQRATATTPVQGMQARIEHMQARLDGMKKVSAAFGKFYASLSPEQQATANSLMGGPVGCSGNGPARL